MMHSAPNKIEVGDIIRVRGRNQQVSQIATCEHYGVTVYTFYSRNGSLESYVRFADGETVEVLR